MNVRCKRCNGVLDTEADNCEHIFKDIKYDLGTKRKPVYLDCEEIEYQHKDCYGERTGQRA